jgi:hypothetical protein
MSPHSGRDGRDEVLSGTPLLVGLASAPAYGPYCPITGERLWPWYTQVLAVVHQCLSLVAIFVGANHVHTAVYGTDVPGRSRAVFLWVAVAVAVHVTGWFVARLGFAVRTLLALGALATVVVAWDQPLPVVFADPELGWTVAFDAARTDVDTFLAEAALPTALVLFALVYAACGCVVTASTVRSVVRSWHLPRRLWFARWHPVWRRRYEPRESAFPLAGVLWVHDDEILADKLVFLTSPARDAAFRLAPPAEAAAPAAIPLGALAAPFTVWRAAGHWWSSRALPVPDGRTPFALRFLFEPANLPVGVDADAAAVPVAPHGLPVRDLFARDEAVLAKHYDEGAERDELFGLLFDSRPELGAGGLPRTTVFVRRGARVRVEHGHPDLLGTPHHEDGRVVVPWRTAEAEPLALELDGARDSVHHVAGATGSYHLYFLAFGARAGGER